MTKKDKQRAAVKRWRANNPRKVRDMALRRNYGIGMDDYDDMLAAQGGVCAICKTDPGKSLHVDHDHATGAVRGLLCGGCNRGIGYLRENPDTLRAAAEYLR